MAAVICVTSLQRMWHIILFAPLICAGEGNILLQAVNSCYCVTMTSRDSHCAERLLIAARNLARTAIMPHHQEALAYSCYVSSDAALPRWKHARLRICDSRRWAAMTWAMAGRPGGDNITVRCCACLRAGRARCLRAAAYRVGNGGDTAPARAAGVLLRLRHGVAVITLMGTAVLNSSLWVQTMEITFIVS